MTYFMLPILLRRQVGMLEKTVDGPYYYATASVSNGCLLCSD